MHTHTLPCLSRAHLPVSPLPNGVQQRASAISSRCNQAIFFPARIDVYIRGGCELEAGMKQHKQSKTLHLGKLIKHGQSASSLSRTPSPKRANEQPPSTRATTIQLPSASSLSRAYASAPGSTTTRAKLAWARARAWAQARAQRSYQPTPASPCTRRCAASPTPCAAPSRLAACEAAMSSKFAS